MKKILIIMVMMFVASGVNAQSGRQKTVCKDNMHAVKQAALNAFRRELIAPSQFILTDYDGNRISVDNIDVRYAEGKKQIENSDSAFFYNGTKWSFRDKYDEPDSIWVYKVIQKPTSPYYVATIIGDARNRAGGYERIIEYVYVYGKASTFIGSMSKLKTEVEKYHVKTIVCKKTQKKEKTVEEMSYEDTLLKEINAIRAELRAGLYIIDGKKVVVTKSSDGCDKTKTKKTKRKTYDDDMYF